MAEACLRGGVEGVLKGSERPEAGCLGEFSWTYQGIARSHSEHYENLRNIHACPVIAYIHI